MENKAMEKLAKKFMAKNENASLEEFMAYYKNNQECLAKHEEMKKNAEYAKNQEHLSKFKNKYANSYYAFESVNDEFYESIRIISFFKINEEDVSMDNHCNISVKCELYNIQSDGVLSVDTNTFTERALKSTTYKNISEQEYDLFLSTYISMEKALYDNMNILRDVLCKKSKN